MAQASQRLKTASEQTGKTPTELAAVTGITVPHYYDLETYDDELYMTLALSELWKLCAEMGISLRYLFSGEQPAPDTPIPFSSLAEMVTKYLDDQQMSQGSFEDLVGWSLADFTTNPESAWSWNADCLRDVCAALGVKWMDALPVGGAE